MELKKIALLSDQFKQCNYFKFGNGYPIILIHGFAEDSRIWTNVANPLAENYQIIMPDLPGSGSSELIGQELTIEILADYIKAIIDQEKIESSILIGHSMGGYISLALTEKYPHYFKGISLVHSTAFADDSLKKENRLKSIKLIENGGKEVFLRAMIPNLYGTKALELKVQEINEHLTMAMHISSQSLITYYKAMIIREDRISTLTHMKKPVHFVIGDEDNAIPFQQSIQQCAIANFTSISILNGIGHSSMIEAPDRLYAALNTFCSFILKQKIP